MIADAALTFGFSYFVAAASPGPNFFVVSHAGLSGSRSASLQTAIGVVLGACVLTVLILSCARWLAPDGRVIGFMECVFAALLLRCAIQAFGRALSAASQETSASYCHHRFLRQGFTTAASNPFTVAFLATAADRDLTALDAVAIVFVIATLWFGFISFIVCHPRLRTLYDRRRWQVESVFGLAFLGLFLKTLLKITSLVR